MVRQLWGGPVLSRGHEVPSPDPALPLGRPTGGAPAPANVSASCEGSAQMPPPPEVSSGIDRAWLFESLARDPVAHAYAAWDIDHEMDRVRFLCLRRSGSTRAYLLIWLGDPSRPFVHWVGSPEDALLLAEHLPPPPATVLAPESLVEAAAARLGPVTVTSLLRLTARPTGPVAASEDPRVRWITGSDVPRLRAWAEGHPDPMVRGYARFDPARHVVWGAFHGERIVGAAFASVRLPEIWTFNGIYVEPFARGEKLGTVLTAYALEASRRAGALAHLNVREDNAPARRVYDRLGFRLHDRVVLIEPNP